VVDDEGNEVQQGEIGELVTRHPMLMQEYYKKPEETIEAFKGGWFHTGDMAKKDEEGYFYLVDRKGDKIISGGENVYPAEVEEIIAHHSTVLEVCVIGVPDEKWGERVTAHVVLKPGQRATEEEIIEFCRGKITGYKRPKSVYLVDSLPKSSIGKILRKNLRETYAKGNLYG